MMRWCVCSLVSVFLIFLFVLVVVRGFLPRCLWLACYHVFFQILIVIIALLAGLGGFEHGLHPTGASALPHGPH